MHLTTAPTYRSRLVDAKIDHIVQTAAALKQKRSVSMQLHIQKANPVEETRNSQGQRYRSVQRVAHRKETAKQKKAEIDARVREAEQDRREETERAEKHFVSRDDTS